MENAVVERALKDIRDQQRTQSLIVHCIEATAILMLAVSWRWAGGAGPRRET